MALEDLSQTVELYDCDRCGKTRHIGELVEDPASPGLLVCPETCADKLGFNEMKAEAPRDSYAHYFK
jgi:transcription elongation factor Elf1